jgi:hypothetical protein
VSSTYELLDQAVAKNPEHQALCWVFAGNRGDQPVSLTYRALLGKIRQTAHLLSIGMTLRCFIDELYSSKSRESQRLIKMTVKGLYKVTIVRIDDTARLVAYLVQCSHRRNISCALE